MGRVIWWNSTSLEKIRLDIIIKFRYDPFPPSLLSSLFVCVSVSSLPTLSLILLYGITFLHMTFCIVYSPSTISKLCHCLLTVYYSF